MTVRDMFEGHPVKERLRAWSQELPGSRWYVVGGAVRDALLGRVIKDVDVLVAGVAPEDLVAFLEARGAVDYVGRVFGVFKFASREGGIRIDIALPRRERSAGTGGYRDVAAQSDPGLPIEDDLARRDFTINAMAWDATEGVIVDPFGGVADLGRKMLRAVGDAETRFLEDCTRMLRALRFSCQLGFVIEPLTWGALGRLMPRIEGVREGERLVPYELIARELLKSLEADPGRAVEMWRGSGAFRAFLPELVAEDAVARRLAAIGPGHGEATFAGLLHDAGPERAGAIAERLRASAVPGFDVSRGRVSRTIDLAHRMQARGAEDWRPSELRRSFLADAVVGDDALLLAGGLGVDPEAYVRRLASIRERCAAPLLDGEGVMRLLGLKPGPEIRQALDLLMDAQAEGKIGSPEEAEAFLKDADHDLRHPLC